MLLAKHSINRYLINTKQLGEILVARNVFRKLADWPAFLFAYIGFAPPHERIIRLSSGIQFAVNLQSTDKWSLHEIVLRDDYRLAGIAQHCQTIIDLGANIGVFAVYAASLNPSTKVYAFEPHPENYSRLEQNIRINALSGQVFAFQLACATDDAGRTFYLAKDHRAHSISAKRSTNTMQIKTKSLEQIFQENGIATCDLLKMDIEGAEYEILYSTPPAILAKIHHITMEYHNINPATGKTGKDLKKYLESHGFAVEQKESLQHTVGQIFAENTRFVAENSIKDISIAAHPIRAWEMLTCVFNSSFRKSGESAAHKSPFPISIGEYRFIKEFVVEKIPNLYQFAVYQNAQGQGAIAKQWSGKRKNLSYYWLMNEVRAYQEVHSMLKNSPEFSRRHAKIHIPQLIEVIQQKNKLLLLLEEIQGNSIESLSPSVQKPIYEKVIRFFQDAQNYAHDSAFKILNTRKAGSIGALFLFYFAKAAARKPQWIFALGKAAFIFITLFPKLAAKGEIGLTHGDLVPSNIFIEKDAIWILDLQLTRVTYLLLDIVYLDHRSQNNPARVEMIKTMEGMGKIRDDPDLFAVYRALSLYVAVVGIAIPSATPREVTYTYLTYWLKANTATHFKKHNTTISMADLQTDYVRNHYNTQIPDRYSGDYELNRWFNKKRTWMDYFMTHRAIAYYLQGISFDSCFELGPGPGTWTRLLYRQNPSAHFTLLDISTEMKKQFTMEMRERDTIEYAIGDFMEYEGKENSYDLFFSSRAIEYLPDKEKAVAKISGLLKPGGTCVVITKNPDRFMPFKKTSEKLHRDQISASSLRSLFLQHGFHKGETHPVIIQLPLVDRVSLEAAKRIFEDAHKKPFEKFSAFAESYIIVCQKA